MTPLIMIVSTATPPNREPLVLRRKPEDAIHSQGPLPSTPLFAEWETAPPPREWPTFH